METLQIKTRQNKDRFCVLYELCFLVTDKLIAIFLIILTMEILAISE